MKRGESGCSLLVGVRKDVGMTSHDVVNVCRRIFGERRVGHTGTLDPLAEGVLPICVGPATRLDPYLTGHDKTYRVRLTFGCETTTDDAQGEIVRTCAVAPELSDELFAARYVAGLTGVREQVPPKYSAVKIDGKRAYALARAGKDVELKARPIEILSCSLDGVIEEGDSTLGPLSWVLDVTVSKGTYIRALARDIGRELGTCSYVSRLERTRAGRIALEDCVALETLEQRKEACALDPVRVLGLRCAFADGFERSAENGKAFAQTDLRLYEPLPAEDAEVCACSSSLCESDRTPKDGELVAIVLANRLKSIYRFDGTADLYKPDCVFSTGVYRG